MSPYDSNIDEEVFFFPKCHDSGWYELLNIKKSSLAKALATELFVLYQECGIQSLIFLQEKDIPWITKLSATRVDFRPAKTAVEYFSSHGLNQTFSGAVQVSGAEIEKFVRHLYNITRSDASFHGANFVDENQIILGYIHSSGEVRLSGLNKKGDTILSKAITKTRFVRNQR